MFQEVVVNNRLQFRISRFEFSGFLIDDHRCDAKTAIPRLKTSEDWLVSHNKAFRANIIVWRMPKDLPTREIMAKLADLGVDSFVPGDAFW